MAPLRQRLIERVRVDGPIPFDEFMSVALYDPDGGFFSGRVLRSSRLGDFLTSPEVSPLFGETLARFVDAEAVRVGAPITVIEVGAGSGSLLRPLLGAVTAPVDTWAVEASPAARAALSELLPPDRIMEDIDHVPHAFRGVVIANELVDNLPMSLAVADPAGWRERWIGVEGGNLVLVDRPARPEVASWCDRFAGPLPQGGLVEVQLAAGEWLHSVLGRIMAGAVLVIDYGDTAENLAPRRVEGTLRTYRSHHLGPHPLDEPGASDITADVNFTALLAIAEEAGAVVELQRQDEFLASLGLRHRLSELRRRELELAREGNATERLKLRSLGTEAETLMHPRGLGDFRVLVARK